jgi:predicted dehydrogenase
MARTVRIAVLGVGSVGQVIHLPILNRLSDVEVVGLVDPQREKAQTIAERFGVPRVAGSLDELAAETDLEAVLVCSPNHAHEEGVLGALEHGCHVLCERPLTTSSDSAARVVEAARRAQRHLMVAMNQRFRYDLRAIKHFVASGELGDVFYVRSTWLNRRARRPRRGWRRDAQLSGGGVLMDLGAQAIDTALWILDYPEVERVSARLHGAGDVEASAAVQLALATGATATVEVTWELVHERDRHVLYALGTEGSARSTPFQVQRTTESGIVDVTPDMDWPPAELYADSYRQEWAEFLRHARGEKPPEVPDDQVRLIRVVEACYRSASEGREMET